MGGNGVADNVIHMPEAEAAGPPVRHETGQVGGRQAGSVRAMARETE